MTNETPCQTEKADMMDVFTRALRGADRVIVETKNTLGKMDAHYILAPELIKAIDARADHLKAAVAAEREACAQKVESNRAHLNFEAMLNLLRDTPLPEPIVTAVSNLLDGIAKAIRARTDADHLAALEQVKREAYERGVREAARWVAGISQDAAKTIIAFLDKEPGA